jgi:nicotinamide riboside transporter PnuC
MPWYQFVDFAATVWAFIWTADFAGLVCGVAGTLLLATKGRLAGWGFVAFLASNLGWVVFALEHGHTKLLAQHLIFAVSSSVGVWVWLVKERVAALLARMFPPACDTQTMEQEIWRRFNGRNASQLADAFGITVVEVFAILEAQR